ncbi:MAG TPA: MogA/MoaB family molybdenum cofactor biosynthesis protein [Anaerolineales bacterium]|nr:MogA/MoaB family molybdenum cofactor biosynthesis protein [Anaerolineales bacterium]
MTLRFGILTVSDRSARGERPDLSGPALEEFIRSQGWTVIRSAVCADEQIAIQETLIAWAEGDVLDVILTTGGTGFTARDVTPEATRAVLEREAPGLAEAMRQEGLKVTPHSMLSRAVTGMRGRVLILNLPGSPKGAVENLQVVAPVLEHAVQLLHNDPDAEKHH